MSFSVIIPSRNAANLVPCVERILEKEPGLPPHRIAVVDDTPDPQPSEIAQFCASTGVTWLRGDKPFIFARNANIGLRDAFHLPGEGACANCCESEPRHEPFLEPSDAVILLNDDALLETAFGFTAMWGAAKNNPEYGLIGATCNNVGNPNQRRQPGGVWLRDEPRMICFVCVLIPRRTIETVGLLDERYVDYGADDDDFSFSVRAAGLKLGIYDGCYVDHGSLKSSYRGDATAGGDFRPNLARFIEKWGVDNWGRTRETSHFKELFPQERAA